MHKQAFTLIELIVGMTISMILMVSIGVFVNSGISGIVKQSKQIDDSNINNDLIHNIQSSLLSMNTSLGYKTTGSGIIFQKNIKYDSVGFEYISQQNIPEVYCPVGSDSPTTKHLTKFSFVPFEEEGEDIISNFSGTLQSKAISFQGVLYHSDQKTHTIRDSGNNIIIGKGVFGNTLFEGDIANKSYLNSPTGLATDGNVLYISDTGNNRILYLDSSGNINTLLSQKDGLREPTGLYYNSSENALYISNSKAGEILKFSSQSLSTTPNLIYTYSGATLHNISKIQIDFFKNTSPENISGPIESDMTISSISTSNDFLDIQTNRLQYHFVNYTGGDTPQTSCTVTGEQLIGTRPVNCTSVGTGILSTYDPKTINSGETISLSNITAPTLSGLGTHYIQISFLNSSNNVVYSEYAPYFAQSDNDLLTLQDNILEVHASGLAYPTGIWGTGPLERNEFFSTSRDFSHLHINQYDNFLKNPLKELIISENNELLFLKGEYYQSYNCYNTDEKHHKTFIINKNLKN